MHIPSTGERVELRLDIDESGLLYLETLVGGRVAYSLPGVISLGWKIVDITPDEPALLQAHGIDIASQLDVLPLRAADARYAHCHRRGPPVGSPGAM